MTTVYSINNVNFQPLEAICCVGEHVCACGEGGGGLGRFAVDNADG